MKIVIVGHRGVGKSSLLKSLAKKVNIKTLLDLDQEIENQAQTSIPDIFKTQGEDYFRKLEQKTFTDLYQKNSEFIISLGGGFQAPLPQDVMVVWIRRETDKDGRIFLNRPRLDPNLSPLEEFKKRFAEREVRFNQICDYQMLIPEGCEDYSEEFLIQLGIKHKKLNQFLITILPEHLKQKNLNEKIKLWLSMGARFIELRDDLLSKDEVLKLLSQIPKQHALISFRTPQKALVDLVEKDNLNYDWDMILGECPFTHIGIISTHEKNYEDKKSHTILNRYESRGFHIKVAPQVQNYLELQRGHSWWLKSPSTRSFLPRSEDGQWMWYRQWCGANMYIHFVCESLGSAADQPKFYHQINLLNSSSQFAAVIGDPVYHSRTPEEQKKFFKEKNMPVYKIKCSEAELTLDLLEWFNKLGLSFLAVTAPLKNKMFDLLKDQSNVSIETVAQSLNSINTVFFDHKTYATNTDLDGLKVLFKNIPDVPMAIWGGGGTVNAIQKILPKAQRYSARTGKPEQDEVHSPKILIWALGRSRMITSEWPPDLWQPETVIDLNYTEDSPGLEYAQKVNAKYISGLIMFEEQARVQREFVTHKSKI